MKYFAPPFAPPIPSAKPVHLIYLCTRNFIMKFRVLRFYIAKLKQAL